MHSHQYRLPRSTENNTNQIFLRRPHPVDTQLEILIVIYTTRDTNYTKLERECNGARRFAICDINKEVAFATLLKAASRWSDESSVRTLILSNNQPGSPTCQHLALAFANFDQLENISITTN